VIGQRTSALGTAVAAVVARPRLWPIALVTAGRFVPRGWWRRFPFLPMPDAAYWRFRMQTAFGADPTAQPTASDVVEFLNWCQRTRAWRR
jgi:hypothetical protein